MSADLFGLSLSSDIWYRRIVLDEVAQDMRQNDYGIPSHPTKHQKLGHSFLQYEAYAKPGTDIKKTEEFLKSRMEEGFHLMPCINLGEEKPFAWYGFRLSPEARDAVEKCEGIEFLKVMDGSYKHFNWASSSVPNPQPSIPETHDPSDAIEVPNLPRYEALPKNGSDEMEMRGFYWALLLKRMDPIRWRFECN
jgi:hypothetical protein